MYTVFLLIDIYLPLKFLVDTSYISVLCSAHYIRKFSETTGPTEAFHVIQPWEREKMMWTLDTFADHYWK